MSDEEVQSAYAARAAEYTSHHGAIEHTHERDRERIASWAAGIEGAVLDAGAGLGQWTQFLADRGAQISGLDLVPEFVAVASERYPEVSFRVGTLRALGGDDGALAGILSWYSIIHIHPSDVPAVLDEFFRVLMPGGHVLIGFFDGPDGAEFAHGITAAYTWSMVGLGDIAEDAGFRVDGFDSRRDPDRRPHATISLVKPE